MRGFQWSLMSENFSARLIFCIVANRPTGGTHASGVLLKKTINVNRGTPEAYVPPLLLVQLAHLPEHERVIERRLVNCVVASRSAAMACAHVDLQEQRVLVRF